MPACPIDTPFVPPRPTRRWLPLAVGTLACALCVTVQAQGAPTSADSAAAPVTHERVVSDPPPLSATAADGQAPVLVQGEQEAGSAQVERPRSAVRSYQEDAGSRVEELRVRGETQEITVTPAGNMPSYDVQPHNSRTRQLQSDRHTSDGTTGPRRWRIGEF